MNPDRCQQKRDPRESSSTTNWALRDAVSLDTISVSGRTFVTGSCGSACATDSSHRGRELVMDRLAF